MDGLRASALHKELGLKTCINAFETVTRYGGSIMRPECITLMEELRSSFVDVVELNRAVSKELARLTGNQAAFVAGGCAAALALSAAAAVVHRGVVCAEQLPYRGPDGQRPNVLIHRGQRNPYDRTILLSGVDIREFGYPTHQARRGQLERAVDDRTVAVFYFAGKIFERYSLSLEEVSEICRSAEIPLIVDAAAQIPPRSILSELTARGADLALFSGGKGIRGPQDTGLIVGDPNLISIIESLSSPHQSFGRPMKTSPEAIVGLLAAVRALYAEDEHEAYKNQMADADALAERLCRIAGTDISILPDGRHGQLYPRVVVRLPPDLGDARDLLLDRLASAPSPVIAGPLDEDHSAIYFNMFAVSSAELPVIVDGLEAGIEYLRRR